MHISDKPWHVKARSFFPHSAVTSKLESLHLWPTCSSDRSTGRRFDWGLVLHSKRTPNLKQVQLDSTHIISQYFIPSRYHRIITISPCPVFRLHIRCPSRTWLGTGWSDLCLQGENSAKGHVTKMAVSVRCTSNAKEYTAPFSHENPLTQTYKSKVVKQSTVGLFIYSSFFSWPPVMWYHVISMHSNHQGWRTCIAKGLEAGGEAKKSRVLGGLNSLIFCLVIEPFACGQLPCSWQCLKGTWLEEVKASSKSQQCNECGSTSNTYINTALYKHVTSGWWMQVSESSTT